MTSSGFLIDSESQIRTGTSTSNMEGMEMEVKEEPEFKKDRDVIKDLQQHNH